MDSTSDGNRPCCRVCRFHDGLYFPKPEISSLEDLRRQSQCLSFGIFKHWILLNKILKRFEAQIQKRWIKRGYDSRLSVLLQAWPDMAATHRPDFASLRKAEVYNNKLLPNRAREKEAYLWPCINREDLTQTHNLLIFLNSRGRHLPDKFVFGDQLQAHTGEHSGDTSETNKFKMSLYGHRSPKTYGQLVPRDTGDKVQQELRMDPVAGLQVLEIQERILDFLVKCCRLILHDFDCDRIDLIEAKSAPPQLVPTEPFSSVTAMAVVAPYRLPQRLDLKRLKMLISARCEEAEEHIWALREDPGYFARAMKEWSEHCPAKIPDKFGRPHEMVGKLEFWDEVATNMVFHAYSSLIFFTATDDAIGIAQEKLEGCRHKLESSCQLPREVELAFQRLDYVVDLLANEPLVDLTLGFAASPPVRYGYERLKSDNQPFFNDLKVKMGRSSTAGRVQMLFRTLLNSDQQQKHGLSNTVEEIQRLIDEQGKDSELISSWVASRFSDLALMTEVSRELSLFQPWYTAWRTRPHVEDSAPYFSRMVQCVHSVLTCANLDLANPARFPYPSDKRRTEKTVIKMRLAEKKLDQFWKVVDAHCEAHTYYSMTSLLMEFFEDWNRKVHRMEPWVEPKDSDRRPAKQDAEDQDVEGGLPLHALDANARCSQPKKREVLEGISPHRVKAKSRPDGATMSKSAKMGRDSTVAVEKEEEKEMVKPMKIKVDKRAFKVFSTMFHVPSANEQHNTGEISWSEFLYSMKRIGFSVEKLFGSSWQFRPDTIDVQRSIQFHEPHPRAKMWYWLSKEYGRRLNRAYGWTGETFDLQRGGTRVEKSM